MIMQAIKIIGMFALLTPLVMMTWVFYDAYFQDDKRTCIGIDAYNEAEAEAFFLVPFLILYSVVTFCLVISDINKELIKEVENGDRSNPKNNV